MSERLVQRAGSAMVWKAVQLGGTKGIYLVRLVLLARILLPDDFGLVAIATSATGFLLAVTNFGMIPALIQGKEMSEERFNAAWSVEVTRSFVVATGILFAAPLIAQLYREPAATNIIRALALRPLLVSLASIKVANLNRELEFRPLAILSLLEAVVSASLSVILATQFGVWGLVFGTLAGSTTYLVVSYIVAPHRPRLRFGRNVAQPLLHFGRWILFTSVITTIAGNVLSLVISRRLGAAELGLYYLATQIAFLPYEAAHEVIGSVAFPLYARLQTRVELAAQTFRTVFIGMTALLFPLCALLFVLAPTLVDEVLGSKWAGTAPIIQVLTIVTMIGLFSEAAIPIFKGLGQPHRETILETVQAILLIAAVWFLADRFGVVGAAAAWIPALLATQILSAVFIKQILAHPFAGLLMPLLAIIFIAAFAAATAVVVNSLLPGLAGLITASVLAVLVSILLMWVSDRQFRLGLRASMARVFPQLSRWLVVHSQSAG